MHFNTKSMDFFSIFSLSILFHLVCNFLMPLRTVFEDAVRFERHPIDEGNNEVILKCVHGIL